MRRALLLLLCLAAAPAPAAIVDYSYTPGHEVELTVPQITGAPSCTGGSGQGNAADEYIIRDNAGLNELASLGTPYTKFFVCPGNYISAGTKSIVKSCSQATPCWVIYYNPNDPGTHPATWAWNSADRTHLPKIDPDGADFWRFVRVQWGKFNPAYTPGAAIPLNGAAGTELISACSRPGGDSDNIIYDQIVCEGFQNSGIGAFTGGSNDNLVLQRSVLRYAAIPIGSDAQCMKWNTGNNGVIVSNEMYDCTQWIQLGNEVSEGIIIENNDFYVSPRMMVDCGSNVNAPVQDNNGECTCMEFGVAIKEGNTSIADDPIQIIGNRFFDHRHVHGGGGVLCGGTGGSGVLIEKSSVNDTAFNVLIARNIIWDYVVPAGAPTGDGTVIRQNELSSHYTIAGNLIDLSASPERRTMLLTFGDSDVYLNTIIGAVQGIFSFDHSGGTDADSFESMCNTFINVGTPYVGNEPADSTIGYDAYIGGGTVTERGGHGGTAFQEAALVNMNFDDLRIPYKLITGVGLTKTFQDVVPTAATPSAYRNLCPGSGSVDRMGSRTGLGVDNLAADWP